MEKRNYLKIVWMLGFLAFASVSCWATAESLHLLLPTWPTALCWIVTIGFFIIASLGTKMIVDSLNQNIYLEKRGLRLCGGVLLLLVFWLICSMPTNTHTFFYRTVINDQVTNDISTTSGYLAQIKNDQNATEQLKLKKGELESEIEIKLQQLENEVMHDGNPGFGEHARAILSELSSLLQTSEIPPISYRGTSSQDRSKLMQDYRKQVYQHLKPAVAKIEEQIKHPNAENIKEAKVAFENLQRLKKYINEGTINLNNPNHVAGDGGVCDRLNDGYSSIKKNLAFVNFISSEDKEVYSADKPVTKVKRLLSVFDVWVDFLKGKYAGHGFAFWIVISILVDIAAFIFFDLAFKKEDF